jgi:hypothetical protein
MLRSRLIEISKIAPPQVLVSIDYKDNQTMLEMKSILSEFKRVWPNNSKLREHFHETNQGLVSHITSTLDESLKSNDCVIVIEDDISISLGFYESALEYMNSKALSEKYATFCGFSALPRSRFLDGFNKFRATPYFACWGWVVTRENWKGYRTELNCKEIVKELSQSHIWNTLSKNQQKTWLGRFNKAAKNPSNTWDIQFQFHTFSIDKENLSPIVRLVDNEGFSDRRSTHTQSNRPRILGRFDYSQAKLANSLVPARFAQLLALYEGLLFYEDFRLLHHLKRNVNRFSRRKS